MKVTAKTAANGWTKEHIQHLLMTNDRAVERALIQIYHRQTQDEQKCSATTEHNSVGFTGFDGELLSSIAANCIKFNQLTPRQLEVVRPKMMKYWKQLLEIASKSPTAPKFERPAAQPKRTKSPKQLSCIQ